MPSQDVTFIVWDTGQKMLDLEESLVFDIFHGLLYKSLDSLLTLKHLVLFFTLLCMQAFSTLIDRVSCLCYLDVPGEPL